MDNRKKLELESEYNFEFGKGFRPPKKVKTVLRFEDLPKLSYNKHMGYYHKVDNVRPLGNVIITQNDENEIKEMENRKAFTQVNIERSGIQKMRRGYFFTIIFENGARKLSFLEPYDLFEKYGQYISSDDPLFNKVKSEHKIYQDMLKPASTDNRTIKVPNINFDKPRIHIGRMITAAQLKLEEKKKEMNIKEVNVHLNKTHGNLSIEDKITEQYITILKFKDGSFEETSILTGDEIVKKYKKYLDDDSRQFFKEHIKHIEESVSTNNKKKRKNELSEKPDFRESWPGSLPQKPFPQSQSEAKKEDGNIKWRCNERGNVKP